jgi:hypothetical protein
MTSRPVACAALFFVLQFPTAIPQTKFASGQDVVPYFEGWIHNADGSFDMVFGYFNRNWQEELAVQAGPDNTVEPGGPDRGQPTYFLPRRQGWVYRVRVPQNFGKQVVTWTIRANGRTETAYGELLPVEEITERIIMTRGNLNPGEDDPNKPPSISIAPVKVAGALQPVTLTALVTDDGLPKPRVAVQKTSVSDATRIQAQANSSGPARPRGLSVGWMQLRGPAKVSFEADGPILVSDGKASATARFAQAGTYVLRATANDGALATRADVTVVVGPGGAGRQPPPIIDNDRVTVWDMSIDDRLRDPRATPEGYLIGVRLGPNPGVFEFSGQEEGGEAGKIPARSAIAESGRVVLINVKSARVAPLENRSPYPNAFPRPGVKKLLENDRVIVWDYSWTPGVPTPTHFHDKDVVVTYVADGALKSTTPDGQSTVNEFSAGTIRFNLRDRVHTELLTTGKARAIITELK